VLNYAIYFFHHTKDGTSTNKSDKISFLCVPLHCCQLLQLDSITDNWMNEWVWWNYNDRGQLGTSIKTCIVPMRPPRIPHGLAWHQNPILAAIGSKYHLRYGMAQKLGFLLSHCIRLKLALVYPAIDAVSVLHKSELLCHCIKQRITLFKRNNFVLLKYSLHRKLLVYELRQK
jgi:hypothetical protein